MPPTSDRPSAPSASTGASGLVKSGTAVVKRLFDKDDAGSGPDARRSLIIGRGEEELRALWSDPQRLGHILAEPYTGHPTTWTAQIESADPDGPIRFRGRSGQETPLNATGSVTFSPAQQDLGTIATLQLQLDGPDPAAGAAAFKALRRAKALIETGEIPTLEHNPSARHDADGEG
jgi:hypothetical protein